MEMGDEDFGDFGRGEVFDFLELVLCAFAYIKEKGVRRGEEEGEGGMVSGVGGDGGSCAEREDGDGRGHGGVRYMVSTRSLDSPCSFFCSGHQ